MSLCVLVSLPQGTTPNGYYEAMRAPSPRASTSIQGYKLIIVSEVSELHLTPANCFITNVFAFIYILF